MTKRDYENEVKRLAALLYQRYKHQELAWDTIYEFIQKNSPWLQDTSLHEEVIRLSRYHWTPIDHDQIREQMGPGDDWKVMRMLTALRAIGLDVFDEWESIRIDPRKRWEPE